MSFDPRNMMCIGCKNNHNIGEKGPLVICFSDQNMIPFITDGEGNCIAIVRMENASLADLIDLSFEVLEKLPPPPGSVIMYGSGSHLFKVGASIYAKEWVDGLTRIGAKWRNINVSPLVPFIRENCPGSMARDIEHISAWFIKVYANNVAGLIDCWQKVLLITRGNTEDGFQLSQGEHYKLPLPASLNTSSLSPHCFVHNSSCPILLHGMDSRTTLELVRVLINSLCSNFSAALSPNLVVQRALAENNTKDFSGQVVVMGASNARNLVSYLSARGFSVTDLTVPGWVASESNIESLISKLKSVTIPPGAAVIIDLLSNSTYRYEQFDGTLALPYKEGGSYHLQGDITVCSDANFKRILSLLQPILLSCQNVVKIIFPPMPRYATGGCCGNPKHSTNTAEDDFAVNLLNKIQNLRGIQKSELLKMGVKNFWLLDGIASVLGFEPKQTKPGPKECAASVKKIMAGDNVHFNRYGYENIAQSVFVSIRGLFNGTLAKSDQITASSVSGPSLKKPTYFWRGFVSPVGVQGPISKSGHSSAGSKSYRHHPYMQKRKF
jgi:hypothetical protein